ncbi:D-alanyl-D-alanine carboxypeptidase family protein [Actinosynnema sp. NPDC050436]|uniref:D-alanyl-D-alanine carboxypeptidase family protein n=1 Tax=Actinosynnema sp. NPDC050436 TaxID=3155659 RepID=UPI0033D7BF4F
MIVRVVIPLVVLLVAGVAGGLGATGRLRFVPDPVPGRPLAILEGVPGPDGGPACSVDGRYLNEPATGLHPEVLAAWQRLVDAAGGKGVRLCLNDGKRSTGQQQAEFDASVRQLGSPELAAKYVLPPEKSMHVKGRAVDIQPQDSAIWVERNARSLGWCRRYDNEYWHFEYDPSYVDSGCPALLPSATGS